MKNIFYDSWVARAVLCFSSCHTIMLFGFVFSKKKESKMTQSTRNHECVHARQWFEVTLSSGILILSLVLAFGISSWWMLLSSVTFYAWYVLEWMCKLPCGNAYRSISFEQEAYDNDTDNDYVENRSMFDGWTKKVFCVVR